MLSATTKQTIRIKPATTGGHFVHDLDLDFVNVYTVFLLVYSSFFFYITCIFTQGNKMNNCASSSSGVYIYIYTREQSRIIYRTYKPPTRQKRPNIAGNIDR